MHAAGREVGGPRGRRRQRGSAGAAFNCVHARGGQLWDEAALRTLSGGLHLQMTTLVVTEDELSAGGTALPAPVLRRARTRTRTLTRTRTRTRTLTEPEP